MHGDNPIGGVGSDAVCIGKVCVVTGIHADTMPVRSDRAILDDRRKINYAVIGGGSLNRPHPIDVVTVAGDAAIVDDGRVGVLADHGDDAS
ncbi:hypothetical protein D3C87_1571050 [compost metagenome]